MPALTQTTGGLQFIYNFTIYTNHGPGPVICGKKAQQSQSFCRSNAVPVVWLPAGQSLQNLRRWSWRTWWRWLTRGKCKQGLGRHGVKAKAGKAKYGEANADQQMQLKHRRSVCEAGRPQSGPVRLWRECGGAGRSRNGLEPTLLYPSNLSPLPVFVHTHSLSLQQQNLDFLPLFFFLFIFVTCFSKKTGEY